MNTVRVRIQHHFDLLISRYLTMCFFLWEIRIWNIINCCLRKKAVSPFTKMTHTSKFHLFDGFRKLLLNESGIYIYINRTLIVRSEVQNLNFKVRTNNFHITENFLCRFETASRYTRHLNFWRTSRFPALNNSRTKEISQGKYSRKWTSTLR